MSVDSQAEQRLPLLIIYSLLSIFIFLTFVYNGTFNTSQLQERIMPPAHPTVLMTLETLAETCLDARRFAHALKCYRQLFDRSQSLEPLDCMKQAATLETMATIHGHLKDPRSKKSKLEMALKFIRSMEGESAYHGAKAERERMAFEKRLQEELDVVQGNLLSKEVRNNWV